MVKAYDSEFKQKRIQQLNAKLKRGYIALFLLGLVVIGVLVIALLVPSTFPQDQHFIIIPLLFFWMFLLRNYPRQYYLLKKDLNRENTSQVTGLSFVHNKPGFRVLFSPPLQLSVEGHSFDLDEYPANQLFIGQTVCVEYFEQSNILLSVTLFDPKQDSSSSDTSSPNSTANALLLSDLEVSIIRLMTAGLADKLIARELELEPATVRTYNSTIYRKLGVKNRKEASQKAQELGLFDVN